MEKVSGEDERLKRRIKKIHCTKYEEFWRKVNFPEKTERKKTQNDFDFMNYRSVVNKRLSTQAQLMKHINRSNNYNIE